MDFDTICSIASEEKQVNEIYNIFHEESRLQRGQASAVEFITTTRYIDRYVKKGMRLLDIGAGAGIYSLHYAKQGLTVDAVELADQNVRDFRKKIQPGMPITLRQGNALDLSAYPDASFDRVLLMGPLYHLHDPVHRSRCIREAKRVMKEDGVLFASFIHHDMVFLTELSHNPSYFLSGDYDHDAMRLHDFPFVFFTASEAREMLEREGIRLLHEVASDGASELMEERINALDPESFRQYLKYHFSVCEKPEMLGMSNHLLLIGKVKHVEEKGCTS